MSVEAVVQRIWYGPAWLGLPLWPLSLIFRLLVAVRRRLYGLGILRVHRLTVPVVVVGNLTVGGTGKTPIALWLGRQLQLRGHRVGIVLRGYGARHSGPPCVVTAADDAAEVGDEALLHVRRGPQVVVIGADRVAAARLAVEQGAEIVVCDDGLQHLQLARDYEIAVVDAARGFGNRLLLPAGPLREPASRIETVDAVVLTRRRQSVESPVRPHRPFVADARFHPGLAVNVRSGERRELVAFRGMHVHAFAGIGNPQAFFAALGDAGITADTLELADHGRLDPRRLPFPDGATVLMTEKDAVKCQSFATPRHWYVPIEARLTPEFGHDLLQRLRAKFHG